MDNSCGEICFKIAEQRLRKAVIIFQWGYALQLNQAMCYFKSNDESLSYRLIGESLQNATYFWNRLADGKLAKWNCKSENGQSLQENQYLIRFVKWRVQNIYKVNIGVGRRRNRGDYISRYD